MKNQERIELLCNKRKYNDNIGIIETETFSQFAIRLCESRDINSGRAFAMCTCLTKNIYNRLVTEKDYIPNENSAYSICFGLQLTFAEACYLLQKARYSLIPTSPNDKYRELLTEMLITGLTYIPDCNKVLSHYGYKELGKTK